LDSFRSEKSRSTACEQISRFLLSVLRCPATHGKLAAVGSELVPEGRTEPRYRVVHGIPLLILEGGVVPEQDRQIVRAFATRSASYYLDNYSAGTTERAARYRLVERIARSIVEPGMLVADIGAGPGVFAELVGRLDARYLAVDLSIDNLLVAQDRVPGLQGVVATATSLPLRDALFDLVLATGCLEYIEAQQLAIDELLRITRHGGYVVASFANALSPRRWWDEGVAHPVRRAVKRSMGEEDIYVRRLTRPAAAVDGVRQAGGEIRNVFYLGQGLVGYPLSTLSGLRRRTIDVERKAPRLGKLAAEVVIVAQRAAP
jgi:ubiquinone/menaquinone biosynthesis C-methylase UbiE